MQRMFCCVMLYSVSLMKLMKCKREGQSQMTADGSTQVKTVHISGNKSSVRDFVSDQRDSFSKFSLFFKSRPITLL